MWGEQQLRTRLGPADPARTVLVPPAAVSAKELIARADAGTVVPVRRRPVLARRPLLAGAAAAAAVAAVAAYALVQPDPDRRTELPAAGVVVPIAYEIRTDPPAAADYLRDLAARITDAPYDGQAGAYAYHHSRTWGGAQIASSEGHVASYLSESEHWVGADGSGRARFTELGVEFPDEESRRYWEAHPQPAWSAYPRTSVSPYSQVDDVAAVEYVAPGDPIPTDPEQRIAQMIGVDTSGNPHFGRIELLYERHLVPRELRASVLEVLAEVPGVMWRGEVTDRADRSGVAVTYDGVGDGAAKVQFVLVFDPQTGELLAYERVNLEPNVETDRPEGPVEVPWVSFYALHLDAGWTDDPGPELDPSPSP